MARLKALLSPFFLLILLGALKPQEPGAPATVPVKPEASQTVSAVSGHYRVGVPRVVASRPLVSVGSAAYTPFVPLLHVDGEGKVHLLWHPWRYPLEGWEEKRVEHRVYIGAEWSPVEILGGTEKLRGMRAVPGNGSGFRLLWCEEQGYYPNYHPERIYLQGWDAGRWAEAERVVDDADAAPTCEREELGFAVDKDGHENVLWTDWREDHFLETLKSGEGDRPKTYYKVRSQEGWGPTKKIQSRGEFDAMHFSVFSARDGALHLFWLETKGRRGPKGYDRVLHMVNRGEGWSGQETVADNRSYGGAAGLASWLEAAPDRNGAIQVAWIWSRSPDGKALENRLEVRELKNGTWGEPVTVSTNAIEARLVQRREGGAIILFQEGEIPAPIVQRDLGNKLYVARIENGRVEGRVLISDETFSGMFDAVEDRKGGIHVVSVEVRQPGRADLIHRILERAE